MWIFLKNAVVSVVEYYPTNGYADDSLAPHDHSTLLVRARRADHLRNLGFADHEVASTPQNDYPFRVKCSRVKFAAMVRDEILNSLDYDNFKGKCAKDDSLPYGMLSEIWTSVRDHLDERSDPDCPF